MNHPTKSSQHQESRIAGSAMSHASFLDTKLSLSLDIPPSYVSLNTLFPITPSFSQNHIFLKKKCLSKFPRDSVGSKNCVSTPTLHHLTAFPFCLSVSLSFSSRGRPELGCQAAFDPRSPWAWIEEYPAPSHPFRCSISRDNLLKANCRSQVCLYEL